MKKLSKLILCLAMVFSILMNFENTHAETYSGTWGEHVTWELDTESGVLTISGTGDMEDIDPNGYEPWHLLTEYITEAVIEDGITNISRRTFYLCDSLEKVTIPASVTSIGQDAFNYCTSLPSVKIPNSVTSIGDSAFYNCSSLESITIPEGVTSISPYTFVDCSSLTSVTLPDSLTSIEYYAFYECSSLPNITIPNSVTNIGYYSFGECSSLESVIIPEGVTSIEAVAFCDCSSLTSVTLPDTLISIKDSAFSNCSSLPDITIPNSVTSIEKNAFTGCSSLTSVTIPASVTSIDSYAFENRSSDLTIYGYVGSAAQKYANQYDINFEFLGLPFTDVSEGKWFYSYIQQAYDQKLMTGKTNTTFDPYANMNRGQVAVVLYRMAEQPDVDYSGKFKDVANGKYYSDAIEWAANESIVTGYTQDQTFRPGNEITRQDFVLMLYRYAKSIGADTSARADLSSFPDASNVSGYAKEALQWAVASGIITGKKVNNQTCIAPKATATRAECCKMLVVANDLINE